MTRLVNNTKVTAFLEFTGIFFNRIPLKIENLMIWKFRREIGKEFPNFPLALVIDTE